ncbi:Gliomedin, partial [Clarias magur]
MCEVSCGHRLHPLIRRGSDLVSDLPLNGRSRRTLWKGPHRRCISAEMIGRSVPGPGCRTKAGVRLQVGIIITSLPETDQSLLQDTERRVWGFFHRARADEKDERDDAGIRSELPDVSRGVLQLSDVPRDPSGRDGEPVEQVSETHNGAKVCAICAGA